MLRFPSPLIESDVRISRISALGLDSPEVNDAEFLIRGKTDSEELFSLKD